MINKCAIIVIGNIWNYLYRTSLLLKCDTDMVASYHVIPYLQCCYASLLTSNAVHDYWKCYINVVTRTCLGFYWYICTLPRVLRALGIARIYQSNPSLPCYNLLMYTCTFVVGYSIAKLYCICQNFWSWWLVLEWCAAMPKATHFTRCTH